MRRIAAAMLFCFALVSLGQAQQNVNSLPPSCQIGAQVNLFPVSGTTVPAYMIPGIYTCTPSASASPTFPWVWNLPGGVSGPLPIVAKSDATAQAANISSSTLYAVPVGGAGMYAVRCYVVVSQAATTSSTMPNCVVGFTDNDTSTVESNNVTATSAGNTVGTEVGGTATINAKANTNITFSTAAYASSGATAMQYAVHVKLEYLGN